MSEIIIIIVYLNLNLEAMENTALVSILAELDHLNIDSTNISNLEEVFNKLKTVNEKLMLVNNNLAGVYDVMEESDK